MAKSLPPLNWFRAFDAAARHLSFTAAAREIGLTQSAVSQQIKALETRLNAILFTRQPRGLALTDAGRQLLPKVSSALDALSNATEGFAIAPAGGQRLTIAASVSVVDWVVSPKLDSFLARHPGLHLRFISAIWPDEFQSARADVEIRFAPVSELANEARLLKPNEHIAVKSPQMDGSIETLPLIEAVGTAGGWKTWRETVQDLPQPTHFTDSYGMALRLAADGNGVALVSKFLAAQAIQDGTLTPASGAEVPGADGFHLSFDRTRPLAAEFADWLSDLTS